MGLNWAFKGLIVKESPLPQSVVALPDDGHSYRPKHVVVNVMNEYVVTHSTVLMGEYIYTNIELL